MPAAFLCLYVSDLGSCWCLWLLLDTKVSLITLRRAIVYNRPITSRRGESHTNQPHEG